ncbi:MAG: hypothetical protein OXQ29_19420 [Rhodospirillaceae bacterium]|nr:hypothetical protein [Rhodospirillaceae bacterium]
MSIHVCVTPEIAECLLDFFGGHPNGTISEAARRCVEAAMNGTPVDRTPPPDRSAGGRQVNAEVLRRYRKPQVHFDLEAAGWLMELAARTHGGRSAAFRRCVRAAVHNIPIAEVL